MTTVAEYRWRRRGTAYVAVLGTAVVVAVVGISALLAVRVDLRSTQASRDFAKAGLAARSGIELVLTDVGQDQSWRTRRSSGTWLGKLTLGDSMVWVEGIDPADGNVANSPTDPLVLTATAISGEARYLLETTLVPEPGPLEALNTCIHAQGQIFIKSGQMLQANGAPLSTNGNLKHDGLLAGSAAAATRSGSGTILGNVVIPAPAKTMPAADVVSRYVALAAPVPHPGTIERQAWGPGLTPSGATHPDGLYVINTGGSDLKIRRARIKGTLVIRCPGRKVVMENQLLIQPARPDYPALIIDGNLEMDYVSSTLLSESGESTNFNPSGVSYQGQVDNDQWDSYPSEIQGLIHVTGSVKIKNSVRVNGTLICNGSVEVETSSAVFNHDPALYTSPPWGYLDPGIRMVIAPGSWRRTVLP